VRALSPRVFFYHDSNCGQIAHHIETKCAGEGEECVFKVSNVLALENPVRVLGNKKNFVGELAENGKTLRISDMVVRPERPSSTSLTTKTLEIVKA